MNAMTLRWTAFARTTRLLALAMIVLIATPFELSARGGRGGGGFRGGGFSRGGVARSGRRRPAGVRPSVCPRPGIRLRL